MKSTTRELTISDELFYEGRELRLLLPNVCRYANFDNRYGSLSLSYWNYWITFSSSISFSVELKISDALLTVTVLILYLPRCIILPTFAALQFLAIPLARLNNLCVNCIFSECDHFKLSFCRSTRNITFVVFFFEMYHSIVNFTFTLVNSNSWHFPFFPFKMYFVFFFSDVSDTYQADFSNKHKSMATWTINENLLSLHMTLK